MGYYLGEDDEGNDIWWSADDPNEDYPYQNYEEVNIPIIKKVEPTIVVWENEYKLEQVAQLYVDYQKEHNGIKIVKPVFGFQKLDAEDILNSISDGVVEIVMHPNSLPYMERHIVSICKLFSKELYRKNKNKVYCKDLKKITFLSQYPLDEAEFVIDTLNKENLNKELNRILKKVDILFTNFSYDRSFIKIKKCELKSVFIKNIGTLKNPVFAACQIVT